MAARAEHVSHPAAETETALILFAWAGIPGLIARVIWETARVAPSRVRIALRAIACALATATLYVFAALAKNAPPDPDTARHLAPYLWPIVLVALAAIGSIATLLAWWLSKIASKALRRGRP
jgi:hypothetical protein